MITEYLVGFIGNSKELAFRVPAMALMSGFLINGRVEYRYLLLLVATFVITYGIFSVYRHHVIHLRDTTPLEAVQSLHKTAAVIERYVQLDRQFLVSGALAALERVDVRKYVVVVVQRVGTLVPRQNGYTLKLFFYSFIPRILWPTKPEISVGKLFNREFGLSKSEDTYIPPTQIGELYWNYGTPGVLGGMAIIGAFLAAVSVLMDLRGHLSICRFLVVVMTVYLLCLRFETGIALQYSAWIRALLCIIVFHAVICLAGLGIRNERRC
jgi:hypothetical protein